MKVKYISGLSNKIGIHEETLTLNRELSVLDLLRELSQRHEVSLTVEGNRPAPDLYISVNGYSIRNPETILKDEDSLLIGYVVAGG